MRLRSTVLARLGLCIFALPGVLAGCSGAPGRISTPGVDAQDAAVQALSLYDRDSDGQLNSEELKASPPLMDAMGAYDSSRDGMLSRDELIAGIESWERRGIGAMALPFTVRLDGRPLRGAEVKLIPAPFLEGVIAPARGTADEMGAGSLEIAGERPTNVPANLPVVQPGLYLVEITHPAVPIPDVYNKASTLGLEAGIAGQNPAGVVWELSSKKK